MSEQSFVDPGGAHHTGADHRTHQKALAVNLDPLPYGTFAEIGGGQEVARWFFRVGGAAGTVAKTMSAYDMQYSDAIYGKAGRYVSQKRVSAMLDHEYRLLIERLNETRGAKTTFFVFADTVSARNYAGDNECNGWLGVRFQTEPGGAPNDILIHVNLLDNTNLGQQSALGMLGVNLIHAALYHRNDIDTFFSSLLDSLSLARIEIDYIQLIGAAFAHIPAPVAGLQLLRKGLCHAIAFDGQGELTNPSELLHKHPVIMQRGSFQRTSPRFGEMLQIAKSHLLGELGSSPTIPLTCFEITIKGARPGEQPTDDQILQRLSTLRQFAAPVIVSDFTESFHVTEYLRRYTKEPIRLVIGVGTLVPLMRSGFYAGIEGGLLEGLGKLLMQGAKMYVFPMSGDDFIDKLQAYSVDADFCQSTDRQRATARTLQFSGAVQHLYSYLLASGSLVAMEDQGSQANS